MKYEEAEERLGKVKEHLKSLGREEEVINNLYLVVAPINQKDREIFVYHFQFFEKEMPKMMEMYGKGEFDIYGYHYQNGEKDLGVFWNYDYTLENLPDIK